MPIFQKRFLWSFRFSLIRLARVAAHWHGPCSESIFDEIDIFERRSGILRCGTNPFAGLPHLAMPAPHRVLQDVSRSSTPTFVYPADLLLQHRQHVWTMILLVKIESQDLPLWTPLTKIYRYLVCLRYQHILVLREGCELRRKSLSRKVHSARVFDREFYLNVSHKEIYPAYRK